MGSWDFVDNYLQEFSSNKKATSTNKKPQLKKQSSPYETSEEKKHKDLKRHKREQSSEKYGDKTKHREDNTRKLDQKNAEEKKLKDKEKTTKATPGKSITSKSDADKVKLRDRSREYKHQETPQKKKDENTSKHRTNSNQKTPSTPSKRQTSTPTKSNERSNTATLSKSRIRKASDKKEENKIVNVQNQGSSGKYDPRKKERELEKQAKEHLDKIYKLNSLIKNKTPTKTSTRVNDKESKRARKTKYDSEQKSERTFAVSNEYNDYTSPNQEELDNEITGQTEHRMTQPTVEQRQTDLDSMAAGDSFENDTILSSNHEDNYNEYEDDFESYESDFEECTESGVSEDNFTETSGNESESADDKEHEVDTDSSDAQSKPAIEEERKLDSGNYDLATQKQRRHIDDIKDALSKENALYDASLSNTDNEIPKHRDTNANKFINFAGARQRQKKEKAKAAAQHRGDKLLEMIRLDAMSFTLLDLPSVPYEVYIQCYGKSNNVQMHTQTNEESLCEEVQTEEIKVNSKWTQHPVTFHTSSSNTEDLLQIFAKERMGVGGDGTETEKEDDWSFRGQTNSLRLHNFLSAAAEVMLALLEEEEAYRKKSKSVLSKNTKNLIFSEGHTPISTERITFLEKRSIHCIKFSLTTKNRIATVHKSLNTERKSLKDECLGRCMICVWSIQEPSNPQKILVSPNEVSSLVFFDNFVIAGLEEGSVCLWDLREKTIWHQRTGLHGLEWTLYSPTFITAKVLNESSHTSCIRSVQCLTNKNNEDEEEIFQSTSISQVATLEEDGFIIIWTIVDLLKFQQECAVNSFIAGLSPWGHVHLVCSTRIDVMTCLPRSLNTKIDFNVMSLNKSHMYIGTNIGFIAHCIQPNGKAQPLIYKSKTGDSSHINCIEPSPYEHPMFLVGTSDGRVRLYQNRYEFPLVDVAGTGVNPGPSIVGLQWSSYRPGVFFVLDENSSLHVWDLCSSDLFPLYSVPMQDAAVSSIEISPHKETSLLAIGTRNGTVEIHKLTSDLVQCIEVTRQNEIEIFSNYISIL